MKWVPENSEICTVQKGKSIMKRKILTSALLVGLIATLLAPLSLANAEETNGDTNLAIGAEVIYATYSHEDATWNWHTSNINDGNPINGSSVNNGGQSGGYHSAYGGTMPDPSTGSSVALLALVGTASLAGAAVVISKKRK